jgi:hypothetical protein
VHLIPKSGPILIKCNWGVHSRTRILESSISKRRRWWRRKMMLYLRMFSFPNIRNYYTFYIVSFIEFHFQIFEIIIHFILFHLLNFDWWISWRDFKQRSCYCAPNTFNGRVNTFFRISSPLFTMLFVCPSVWDTNKPKFLKLL